MCIIPRQSIVDFSCLYYITYLLLNTPPGSCFMLGRYPANLLLLRCPLVPEIMHGGEPDVFLHHLSWEAVIYPLQCWWVIKPNQKNEI